MIPTIILKFSFRGLEGVRISILDDALIIPDSYYIQLDVPYYCYHIVIHVVSSEMSRD
jgi:hypothetical protein